MILGDEEGAVRCRRPQCDVDTKKLLRVRATMCEAGDGRLVYIAVAFTGLDVIQQVTR